MTHNRNNNNNIYSVISKIYKKINKFENALIDINDSNKYIVNILKNLCDKIYISNIKIKRITQIETI